jgi:preprotein translocase subunit SecA
VAKIEKEHPHVVHPKNVIGMVVGKRHGVGQADSLAEKLLPEVGRGIDQQVALGQSQGQATTCPLVLGIAAGAYVAATSDHGHADTGSRAQEYELSLDVGGDKRNRQGGEQLGRPAAAIDPRASVPIHLTIDQLCACAARGRPAIVRRKAVFLLCRLLLWITNMSMENLERVWDATTGFFNGISNRIERSITGLFGSSNARYIKKLQPHIDAINALEPKYQAMSDVELRAQTDEFKKRLAAGQTLDDLLVEAFAVCREAGRRWLGMRHYDVQLIGGMVLHSGAIAEMVTGEGKTLVATLPAYLNALEGKGVHVVTVNDYLARRDMEWMGPLYLNLGLTVGAIQGGMDAGERQKIYACDITYGTNNEFGFDYLRDNMRLAARDDDRFPKHEQQAQGPLHYAIIDEVDNILIDEARTPLIISGPAHDDVRKYARADQIARQLNKDVHFEIKEKEHSANLTDEGVRAAEKLAGVESFYTAGNMEWPHLIDNALKAHHLYKRDVNYIVQQNPKTSTEDVIIVDEFTGRLMPGRQWSDGLHQAVEAKEGVKIKEETQTLATITLQNFFKLYDKICGMTGTAMTEAGEFWKIYKLDVIAIPTNRSMRRLNYPDVIYMSEREKYAAVADEIERINKWDVLTLDDASELWGRILKQDDEGVTIERKDNRNKETVPAAKIKKIEGRGRPVLVGTVSIEKSERLSSLLERRGIKHQVLNAKHHKREAEIVAQAGRFGSVTIATNMAGRGTDIILGGNPDAMAWAILQDKYPTRLDVPQAEWDALVRQIEEREQMKAEGNRVKELGGLHCVGTERHESRRIALQLRGRCGRQGDPGSSRFYLSLEDDLMRIFAGDWVKSVLQRLGMQEGEAIESRMVSRRIEGAQKKVEERNFEIRKNLLEYDEVMDEQRKRVYGYRQRILNGANCKQLILDMIEGQVEHYLTTILDKNYGTETFAKWASNMLSVELKGDEFAGLDFGEAERFAKDEASRLSEQQIYEAVEENLPESEDQADWNWGALATFANVRWKTSLRDRDLKKVGRDNLVPFLIEKANEAIEKKDLSEGARFLERDFAVQEACAWVEHKFGLKLKLDEVQDLDAPAFKDRVRRMAMKAYDEREIEYPVMAAFAHFGRTDSSGQRRIDRDALARWAAERFHMNLTDEDFKSKQREEIYALLIEQSRVLQRQAEEAVAEVKRRLSEMPAAYDGERRGALAGGGNGKLTSLADWLRRTVSYQRAVEELAKLDGEKLEQELITAVDDHYRPEIRRMERTLLLQLLDMAWKDHLLAMDHLRSSVSLRGYAQVDPKVEYKREGMSLFDNMWISVGERVTDLIFRMEQLDEGFVGSTWKESEARHDEVGPGYGVADQQQQAIENSESDADAKIEPIRNTQPRVGRNEPCPCGSGKKYKHCHGRPGGAVV